MLASQTSESVSGNPPISSVILDKIGMGPIDALNLDDKESPQESQSPQTEPATNVSVAASTSFTLVMLEVSSLTEHAVAKEMPNLETEQSASMLRYAMERGVPGERPVVVLTDRKTVIFGFHELQAARQAQLATVPCRIVDEPDPREYALRNMLLVPQLNKDQLAVIAWKLKEHLSKKYRLERAAKGGAKKAGRSLSAQCADKHAKRDARKEIAVGRQVSERALKNLDAISGHEKKHKPKGDSAIDSILAGKLSIATALKKVTTEKEKASDQEDDKQVANLTPLEDWVEGEPINALRERIADQKIGMLLIDNPEKDVLKRILDVGVPNLAEQASVVCLVDYEQEAQARALLESADLRVSRPLIIDTSKSAKGKMGQRHLSVLRAVRPEVSSAFFAAAPPSDILTDLSVQGRAVTLHTIFGLFIPHNKYPIVQPLAPDESGYQAAKTSHRSILAVAVSHEVYLAGREAIEAEQKTATAGAAPDNTKETAGLVAPDQGGAK